MNKSVQVVSNGRFRSIQHRTVTNMYTSRISIPTFYLPGDEAFIAPASSMVDEQKPAVYRGYKFEEFLETYWELKGKSVVDRFNIE